MATISGILCGRKGITGAPTAFCDILAARLHDLLVTYFMELFMDDGGCVADMFREMMDKLTLGSESAGFL
jgi:hypothetical protein